jgi:hypothetical protein
MSVVAVDCDSPICKEVDYAGEDPIDYGAEVSSIQKAHAAHTSDNKYNNGQSPLEPAPLPKDYVASPSKDTVGQRALYMCDLAASGGM